MNDLDFNIQLLDKLLIFIEDNRSFLVPKETQPNYQILTLLNIVLIQRDNSKITNILAGHK